MTDSDENVITYETFRKFQKQERDSENLQKLPEDFFESCAEWINRKGKAYQDSNDSMAQREIENVLGIIKDILDRRERKLLLMAMHAVRTDAVPQNLHPYEEKCFDSAVENLKNMREMILAIIKGDVKEVPKAKKPEKKPEPKEEKPESKTEPEVEPESKEETRKEEQKPEPVPDEILPKTRQEKSVQAPVPEPEESKEEPSKEKPNEEEVSLPKIVEPPGYKMVRILEEVPKFLGTDGKAYGPFRSGDLVTLEKRIAELLVSKGKVEFTNI